MIADPCHVTVYTLGWVGDRAARDGEDPRGQLHSRVFLNGEELKYVNGVKIEAAGGDFVKVTLSVHASSIRFVPLSNEEWQKETLPT